MRTQVVHITSGFSALASILFLGKRTDFGETSDDPHNVPFVALGTALLWSRWRVVKLRWVRRLAVQRSLGCTGAFFVMGNPCRHQRENSKLPSWLQNEL